MEDPYRASKRRSYTNEERLRIATDYEACTEIGEKSALCRRLGISPHMVRRWAREMEQGLLTPDTLKAEAKRNTYQLNRRERSEFARVKRENEALKEQLAQSQSMVEVLGKASALLESLAKSAALHQPQEPEPEPGPAPMPQIPSTFLRAKPEP